MYLKIPFTPFRERLLGIVNQACNTLCRQIASGKITVDNETSLQLYLASLLQQIGKLYEYEPDTFFTIELEKKFNGIKTCKSSGTALCDIFISIKDGANSASAAIELKYLKKSKTAAVTDSRFSVIEDIENVEQYKHKTNLGFVIVLTNNINYVESGSSQGVKFNISHGEKIGDTTYTYRGKKATIDGKYTCSWREFSDDNWVLKIDI